MKDISRFLRQYALRHGIKRYGKQVGAMTPGASMTPAHVLHFVQEQLQAGYWVRLAQGTIEIYAR